MAADLIVEAAGDPRDGPLELRVLERGHPPAAVADEMVVVLAVRVRGLESGRALTDVETLDQPQPLEQLERAIDGRDADVLALVAEAIGDLARAQDALLLTEQAHDP